MITEAISTNPLDGDYVTVRISPEDFTLTVEQEQRYQIKLI